MFLVGTCRDMWNTWWMLPVNVTFQRYNKWKRENLSPYPSCLYINYIVMLYCRDVYADILLSALYNTHPHRTRQLLSVMYIFSHFNYLNVLIFNQVSQSRHTRSVGTFKLCGRVCQRGRLNCTWWRLNWPLPLRKQWTFNSVYPKLNTIHPILPSVFTNLRHVINPLNRARITVAAACSSNWAITVRGSREQHRDSESFTDTDFLTQF